MSDATLTKRRNGLRKFQGMLLFAFLFLISVTLLYVFEPFSDFWNDLFSNIAAIFPAGLCAVLASQVLLRYSPSDQPRRVWVHLSIGLWLWTIAEVIWGYYNMMIGEVSINIADLFWVLAYGFFGYAVYIQYQIIFHPDKRLNTIWTMLWIATTFILMLGIAWLLVRFTDESWGFPLLLASFYPAADIAIGLSAIRIVWRFRGGALAYPWIGLSSFSIADTLYAFVEFSGLYAWSVSQGNFWSTTADVSYVAAYLFVALGCYAQLLLLKHGPIFTITWKDHKRT